MQRALVLDAKQRSALATTRALGRAGVDVVTADSRPATLAGHSRYSRKGLVYPDPYDAPARFVDELPAIAAAHGVSVILPMTEVTTYVIAQNRNAFANFHLPLADFDAFEAMSDKYRLFRLAERLGLPMPETWFVDQLLDIDDVLATLPYPLVIKPFRSRILENGRWFVTAVSFAKNENELRRQVESDETLQRFPFLLQAYVEGDGAGIFTHYERGQPLAFFSHRRLRERPPTGGVSVLSESVSASEDMTAIARQLLGEVAWHGPAMVEFKIGRDGVPYLMEINPRFWGSLQLAVDAGVNFPLMMYRSALGQAVNPVDGYTVGARLRWLLGDLDSLYMTLRDRERPVAERVRETLRFMNPGFGRVRYEVNRWGDLRPFWYELRHYFDD